MGWTWGWQSRKAMIAEFKRENECSRELAGCYKGAPWKGKYWQVLEAKKTGERFIVLYLCEYDRHSQDWGYKDICESMGPYYYDCPIKYLDMTPPADEHWREGVRANAELTRVRRKARKEKRESSRNQ